MRIIFSALHKDTGVLCAVVKNDFVNIQIGDVNILQTLQNDWSKGLFGEHSSSGCVVFTAESDHNLSRFLPRKFLFELLVDLGQWQSRFHTSSLLQ